MIDSSCHLLSHTPGKFEKIKLILEKFYNSVEPHSFASALEEHIFINATDLPYGFKRANIKNNPNIIIFLEEEEASIQDCQKNLKETLPHNMIYCSLDFLEARLRELLQIKKVLEEDEKIEINLQSFNIINNDKINNILDNIVSNLNNSQLLSNTAKDELRMAAYEIIENVFVHNKDKIEELQDLNDTIANYELKRNNNQVKLIVKDIFGTITQQNIHTFQKLNPMMDVKKGGVGAGIGLNLAWRNSSSLIFNIQKNRINSVQIGQYLESALEEKRRKFGKIFYYDLSEDQ